MLYSRILLALLTFSPLLNAKTKMPNDRPAKPNIIILLTDDLGWQDVKCYDIDKPSPMETPNLDKLAKRGILFWQGYSPAPVCAPSRAAILSGHHPVRGEMTSVAGGKPPYPAHNMRQGHFSPYYTARMPISTYTIAEALQDQGYTTGHSGKWHISKSHYNYPNPFQHGFDYSLHERGVQSSMKPDRLTGFATKEQNDPFRLDENGFPTDAPQQGAMKFLHDNKSKPFFLYYATWLVHTPIVMRSEQLLRKYEQKLGVKITEEHIEHWKISGQTNPFYCAMVEQLDYYFGQIFTYLDTTEDPRWPGHKLSENTYIFFTSDNGGMEGGPKTIITDNYPLDHGKISSKEGGVRVPFIVAGPTIPQDKQSDVMVNGLDFYPTILSLIGADKPKEKIFDGCDLTPLLHGDISDPQLVKLPNGNVRNSMMWHFPQMQNSSAIRIGDYKLVRYYRGIHGDKTELYRLYDSTTAPASNKTRVDIEEMKDLAAAMPEKVKALATTMDSQIKSMGGRYPYFNPATIHDIKGKKQAPKILGHTLTGGNQIEVTYQENGSKISHADLLYTTTGATRKEEWLRKDAKFSNGKITATLPDGTTHFFINLIDENNFLDHYPIINGPEIRKTGAQVSKYAAKVK